MEKTRQSSDGDSVIDGRSDAKEKSGHDPCCASARQLSTARLMIEGMTCASCVKTVEDHARHVPGVVSISVNLILENASVVFDRSIIAAAAIAAEIEDLGYDCSVLFEHHAISHAARSGTTAHTETLDEAQKSADRSCSKSNDGTMLIDSTSAAGAQEIIEQTGIVSRDNIDQFASRAAQPEICGSSLSTPPDQAFYSGITLSSPSVTDQRMTHQDRTSLATICLEIDPMAFEGSQVHRLPMAEAEDAYHQFDDNYYPQDVEDSLEASYDDDTCDSHGWGRDPHRDNRNTMWQSFSRLTEGFFPRLSRRFFSERSSRNIHRPESPHGDSTGSPVNRRDPLVSPLGKQTFEARWGINSKAELTKLWCEKLRILQRISHWLSRSNMQGSIDNKAPGTTTNGVALHESASHESGTKYSERGTKASTNGKATHIIGTQQGVFSVVPSKCGGALRITYDPHVVGARELIGRCLSEGLWTLRWTAKAEKIMGGEGSLRGGAGGSTEGEQLWRLLCQAVWPTFFVFVLMMVIPMELHGSWSILNKAILLPGVSLRVTIALLLATPVQFISGFRFHRSAWQALKRGHLDMNVLISTATNVAYFYSFLTVVVCVIEAASTAIYADPTSSLSLADASDIQHHLSLGNAGEEVTDPPTFFETCAVLLTVLLLGRLLEYRAKQKTMDLLHEITRMQPQRCQLLPRHSHLDLYRTTVHPAGTGSGGSLCRGEDPGKGGDLGMGENRGGVQDLGKKEYLGGGVAVGTVPRPADLVEGYGGNTALHQSVPSPGPGDGAGCSSGCRWWSHEAGLHHLERYLDKAISDWLKMTMILCRATRGLGDDDNAIGESYGGGHGDANDGAYSGDDEVLLHWLVVCDALRLQVESSAAAPKRRSWNGEEKQALGESQRVDLLDRLRHLLESDASLWGSGGHQQRRKGPSSQDGGSCDRLDGKGEAVNPPSIFSTAFFRALPLEVSLPTPMVEVGDILKIVPGQLIPVDGTKRNQDMNTADESILTGESKPVEKFSGDALVGGSTNLSGLLFLRTDEVGVATTMGQIVSLVSEAQASKTKMQLMADTIAGFFVPIIFGLAASTWLTWCVLLSYDVVAPPPTPSNLLHPVAGRILFALQFGIGVLAIACPCSLGLATPTAVMVATGVAARLGILVKGGAPLESASTVKVIVLDKTGTITKGSPEVRMAALLPSAFVNLPQRLRTSLLCSMNRAERCDLVGSDNPLSVAISNVLSGVNDKRQAGAEDRQSDPSEMQCSADRGNNENGRSTTARPACVQEMWMSPPPAQAKSGDLKDWSRLFWWLVAVAESASEHPLGRALTLHVKQRGDIPLIPQPKAVRVLQGQGIQCSLETGDGSEEVQVQVTSVPSAVASSATHSFPRRQFLRARSDEEIVNNQGNRQPGSEWHGFGQPGFETPDPSALRELFAHQSSLCKCRVCRCKFGVDDCGCLSAAPIKGEAHPDCVGGGESMQSPLKERSARIQEQSVSDSEDGTSQKSVPPSEASELQLLRRWSTEQQENGCTVTAVYVDKNLLGAISLRDPVKMESKECIEVLRSEYGLDVWICSGDTLSTSVATAKEVGISKERVIARAMPIDKNQLVKRLRSSSSGTVCMVGDGVNDSLALAEADLGVAIGAGAHVAVSAADAVLVKSSLLDLVNLLKLSRATVWTIRRNFCWSFVFNLLGVPLAAGVGYPWGVLIPPALAGSLMALSSVVVVGSSLLLKNFQTVKLPSLTLDRFNSVDNYDPPPVILSGTSAP